MACGAFFSWAKEIIIFNPSGALTISGLFKFNLVIEFFYHCIDKLATLSVTVCWSAGCADSFSFDYCELQAALAAANEYPAVF